jgi:ADP-heptose:LPS heptosyltransferase
MANELFEHSDYHAGILKRESYNHFFKLAGSGRFHNFEHELDRIDIFVKNAGLRELDKDCLEWKSYNIQPIKNNNIIIIPKASHPARTWDLSCKKQIELCNKLLEILENNQYIEIHCNDYLPQFEKLDNRIINMTGKLSTEQHINRLVGCKYIVCCGDTGGIFVGAVFGVKGIALYGHVHPSTRLKYFPEIKYIYKEKACQYQPCEYLKRKFCKRECMNNISVEEVFEIIKEDLCR